MRDNKHIYEVGMTGTITQPNRYFTRHVMQIKPKNGSEWYKHDIKHQLGDHKSVIGDSMSYTYPVGSEPTNPTCQVTMSVTIDGWGTTSWGALTLSNPT